MLRRHAYIILISEESSSKFFAFHRACQLCLLAAICSMDVISLRSRLLSLGTPIDKYYNINFSVRYIEKLAT